MAARRGFIPYRGIIFLVRSHERSHDHEDFVRLFDSNRSPGTNLRAALLAASGPRAVPMTAPGLIPRRRPRLKEEKLKTDHSERSRASRFSQRSCGLRAGLAPARSSLSAA